MFNGLMFKILLVLLWISQGISSGDCSEDTKSISEINAGDSTTSKPASPDCSAEFRVTVEAKAFSIPRSNNGEPIECSWLLKSDHINQRIGVTTLNTSLEIGTGECFRLEARDGSNHSSPILKSIVYCNDTFIAWDWPNEKTMVSSSNYMLLKYSSKGKNPLSMDLLYYTCGGETDAEIYIASPVFKPEFAVTQIVECQWKFTKHPDAVYGSIRLLNVNINETSVLQVCTDGGMKNLNFQFAKKNSNRSEPSVDNTRNKPVNSTSVQSELKSTSSTDDVLVEGNSFLRCNNGLPGGNGSVQSVVGGAFNLMIFDGEIILVLYRIQRPRRNVGFNALYFPVKLPKHPTHVTRKIPWYINYSGVAIYTPIGVILGLIIIGLQNRKRGPSKSELGGLADAILSDPSDSDVALQVNLELDDVSTRCRGARKTQYVHMLSPLEEAEQYVKPKVKLKSSKKYFVVVSLNDLPKSSVCRTASGRSLSTSDLDFFNQDENKLEESSAKSLTLQNLNNNNNIAEPL